MKPPASIWLLLIAALVASCASKRTITKTASNSSYATFSERLNQSNGYTKDKGGNWVPKNDKRSSFEKVGDDPNFKGDYKKKDYKTSGFATNDWQGSKSYDHKSYKGNTQELKMKDSTETYRKDAGVSKPYTNLPDNNYATKNYSTHDARESKAKRLYNPADNDAREEQKSFPMPDVIDYKQQRGLSLEQSKKMLGH